MVAAPLAGCEADTSYGACSVDNRIEAVCRPGVGQRLSCVVADHPDCPDRVCLTFEGSSAFCTVGCDPALNNCPSGGKCTPFLQTYYCVAPGLLPE